MGLWHGVEHFEKMKISEGSDVELFVKSWPELLTENVEFKYDWSYIVSWVGVGMALCSSILFSLAAVCIKNDREREEAMNMQYLMPGKMFILHIPGFLPVAKSHRSMDFNCPSSPFHLSTKGRNRQEWHRNIGN